MLSYGYGQLSLIHVKLTFEFGFFLIGLDGLCMNENAFSRKIDHWVIQSNCDHSFAVQAPYLHPPKQLLLNQDRREEVETGERWRNNQTKHHCEDNLWSHPGCCDVTFVQLQDLLIYNSK